MFFLKKSRRGETILEIMISISMLIFIVGPISQLIVSSMRSTSGNRDELIAEPIAQDGIEQVRVIVYTNFLKFAARGSECFASKPEHENIDTCEEAVNTLQSGSYALTVDADPNSQSYLQWQWTGQVIGLSEDLSEQHADTDAPYALRLDPATHLYNSTRGDSTKYYREVVLDVQDTDGDGKKDAIAVTSRVRFWRGGKVNAIVRTTVLRADE